MSRLVGLYPRVWRARYGPELEDLVAARPFGARVAIDVIRGAFDAHRHPELADPSITLVTGPEAVSPRRYADLVVARRLGIASWIGSLLWIGGWLVAVNGPLVHDVDHTYRDGAAGMPFLLAALLLLSAGLAGQLVRLSEEARTARAGAAVAMLTAPFWGLGPWVLVLYVLLVVSLLLLAAGAWWRSEWSGGYSVLMLTAVFVGSIVAAVAFSGLLGGLGTDIGALGILLLLPAWLVVGATLQSLPEVIDLEAGAARDETAPGIAPA